MSISLRFKRKCHTLYDQLHGPPQISLLFDKISDRQVEDLVKVYKMDILERWQNIENYLISEDLNNDRATSFYINALQHFTDFTE